jgi:hypothetical protein
MPIIFPIFGEEEVETVNTAELSITRRHKVPAGQI